MILYKRGVGGEVRSWYMEQVGDQYRTHSGVLNGAMTASGWTTCTPKNVGRSNETTAPGQAIAEVNAHYNKKQALGYFPRVADIDKVEFTKPMLAHAYEGNSKFPVLTQPKLDGMRCIARVDGLWSRTGKPITSVPHIYEALKPAFAADPDLVLDGELYNHDLKDDFGTLMSLLRKASPAPGAEKIAQYHVYDVVVSEEGVEYRQNTLGHLAATLPDCIKLVETRVAVNTQELDVLYSGWLEDGYEGQMIRAMGSAYENKRSKNLLKRKDFLCEEFRVVRVEEGNGNWAGYAKRFVFRLADGRECGAGVRGNQETLQVLLQGETPTWATVRFFTHTPDGMPRFPVVTDWGFTPQRQD